jgi:hypothetical protein
MRQMKCANLDLRSGLLRCMRKQIIFPLIILVVSTGCLSGPCRYKTLGYNRFGTFEFTKRAHPIIKPVAAAGGIVTDAALISLDTVVNIVIGFPITWGGPDGSGVRPDRLSELHYWIMFYPLWYGTTLLALGEGIWPIDVYEELFGKESPLFQDSQESIGTPNDQTPAPPQNKNDQSEKHPSTSQIAQ